MDVRCEKCKTEYVFEDERVGEAGVTVRCTECDHVFKVRRGGVVVEGAPPPAPPVIEPQSRPWLLKKQSGETFTFESLATLHSWIVERRVTRQDRISRSGKSWKELGELAELATFFHVVDQADQAARDAVAEKEPVSAPPPAPTAPPAVPPISPFPEAIPPPATPAPSVAPSPEPAAQVAAAAPPPASPPAAPAAGPTLGDPPPSSAPAWTGSPPGGDDLGDIEDEDFDEFRSGGKAKWVLAFLVLLLAGGGVFYYLDPDRAMGLIGLGGEVAEAEPEEPAGEPVEQPTEDQDEALAQDTESAEDEEAAGESSEDVAEAEADAEEPAAQDDASEQVAEAPPEEAPAAKAPAVERPPATPPAPRQPTYEGLLRSALAARNRGQIETALDLYSDAARIRPNRAEPHAGQGFCYIEMRAWHAAIASFEQALQHNSRHGDSIIGLAEANRLQGNTDQAKRLYERYLSLYPDGPEAAVAQTNLERM